jgi:hypothetical protein
MEYTPLLTNDKIGNIPADLNNIVASDLEQCLPMEPN